MKCFVVADVHSFYDEMMEALNKKGFDKDNPQHVFISLGDLLDRGNKPLECLDFVNSLERKILIKGNHEDLLEDVFDRKFFMSHDYHNGTAQTCEKLAYFDFKKDTLIDDYKDVISKAEESEELKKYLSSLIDYFETDKYVGVHGWIPRNEDWRGGDWSSSRWKNGMEEWDRGIRVDGKTVLCGHWHTSWGHRFLHHDGLEFNNYDVFEKFFPNVNIKGLKAKFTPFKDNGIIALDACTAYSGFVNCIVLNIAKKQLEKYLCLPQRLEDEKI